MNSTQGVAMRKDTIFRIASMTKALTSTAVMMLVEVGKLGLDDEVLEVPAGVREPAGDQPPGSGGGHLQTAGGHAPDHHPATADAHLRHRLLLVRPRGWR